MQHYFKFAESKVGLKSEQHPNVNVTVYNLVTTTQTQQPSTPLIFVRTRIREVQPEYMR